MPGFFAPRTRFLAWKMLSCFWYALWFCERRRRRAGEQASEPRERHGACVRAQRVRAPPAAGRPASARPLERAGAGAAAAGGWAESVAVIGRSRPVWSARTFGPARRLGRARPRSGQPPRPRSWPPSQASPAATAVRRCAELRPVATKAAVRRCSGLAGGRRAARGSRRASERGGVVHLLDGRSDSSGRHGRARRELGRRVCKQSRGQDRKGCGERLSPHNSEVVQAGVWSFGICEACGLWKYEL